MKRSLKGRRVAVLATHGFEKVELTLPVTALKAAGAEVDIVSFRRGKIRGVNLHEPASRVRVTKTLKEADPADYDALLLPGGFINPDLLRQSVEARKFVLDFDRSGRPIATLCHGPWVLSSAGVLRGRVLTSWPGVRDDLVNAGATWLDQPLVEDGNLITSRGPQDLVTFIRAMIQHFAPGASMRRHTRAVESSPQRDKPPKVVLGAMKWLPKPSIRAAVIAMIAAGLVTAQKTGTLRRFRDEVARRAA